MKPLKILIPLILTLLAGCATLTDENSSARLVTMYAVLKVSAGDPAKATRISEIAADVHQYASDAELLTVDALIVAIRAEIKWASLDAADTLLVNALIDRLRVELIEYLGPDALPEDVKLAVTTVAEWCIEAASLVQ